MESIRTDHLKLESRQKDCSKVRQNPYAAKLNIKYINVKQVS